MKRMIALLLLVVMICTSLCSCSSNTNSNSNSDGMDYADEGEGNIFDGSSEDDIVLNNPNTQCYFDAINSYLDSTNSEIKYTSEDNYFFYTKGDGIIYMAKEDETGKIDTARAYPVVGSEYDREYMNGFVEMPECFKTYSGDAHKVTLDCNFLQAVNGYIYWADAYSIWRVNYVKQTKPELVATTGLPLYMLATPFYIKDGYLYTCENSYYSQESSSEIDILSGFVRYNLDTLGRELIDVTRVSTSIINKYIQTDQTVFYHARLTASNYITNCDYFPICSTIYAANSEGVFYYGFCFGNEEKGNIRKYDVKSNSTEDTGVNTYKTGTGEDAKEPIYGPSFAIEICSYCSFDDLTKIVNGNWSGYPFQYKHIYKTNNGIEYRVEEIRDDYGFTTSEFKIYVNDKLVKTEGNSPDYIFNVSVYGNYVYYVVCNDNVHKLSRVNIDSGEYEFIC